ncbi:hypothetical protein GLOTRDRAFT_106465 [Gloeophyllum trabeum ATCC 11539]|uniref:Uncharacterized protein n=1 Tax=Gloeophyllum trabeum (strain ATCC 11539 / FP-39264 / Madison 617) TaxID=670483 RepID=S7Q4C3_GLOTA|nr:uncharacterized protein GLOTRDRAFT_106465 [Gloeophyllum trabeum ATCC 11539]EPQ54866.1 hypothetical protein GLOTRDRAFT_106465 [Gloeophyllum trabeum ATCC 11539]
MDDMAEEVPRSSNDLWRDVDDGWEDGGPSRSNDELWGDADDRWGAGEDLWEDKPEDTEPAEEDEN